MARHRYGCICPGTTTAKRSRWVVRVREGNHSAFNGYRFTRSRYSEVSCLGCGRRWRTDAGYVADLPDRPYTDPDFTRDLEEPDDRP